MKYISEIEYLYLPSCWCKRFKSSEEVLNQHIKFTTKESESTRKKVPCELNCKYGISRKTSYDLFGTDLDDNAPILIYIHGGYWQEESITKDSSSFIAYPLYENKIKSMVLEYELCPNVTLLEITEQIEKGIQKCIDYAKQKGSRRIYLAGHSAGAHLVANLLATFIPTLSEEDQSLFKSAFLIAGVYDLKPLIGTSINDLLVLDMKTATRLSPMNQRMTVKSKMSIFVIVGEDDSPAFIGQSRNYHKKLMADGWSSNLAVFDKIDHFNIIEEMIDANFRLTKTIIAVINY